MLLPSRLFEFPSIAHHSVVVMFGIIGVQDRSSDPGLLLRWRSSNADLCLDNAAIMSSFESLTIHEAIQ